MKEYFCKVFYGLIFILILGFSSLPIFSQEQIGENSQNLDSTFAEMDRRKPTNSRKSNKPRHAFAKLVKANDSIIRYLGWLFTEQGISPPSQVYPISFEEIRYIMKEYLDRNKLSILGRFLYDQICKKTEEFSTWGMKDWVALDPILGITAEFYVGLYTKDSRNWYLYSFKDRPAFIDIGVEVSLFDHLYINTTAHIKQDQTWIDWNTNSLMGNIITNFSSIYAMMPQDAYASLSFSHFNLQGGRGVLSWGNGRSGNLMLSDAPSELDYFQAATWWRFIKFTSLWVFLDYSLPMRNSEGDIIYYNAGGKLYAYAINPIEQIKLGVQPSQFFLAHRLDFKLGERMNLSLSEAILYKDYWQNVAFLNPFFIFHSWYLKGQASYFLSIDIEIALTRYWIIYTQILFDQGLVGLNHFLSLGSIPFLIGTQVVHPLGQGYLSWVFEFVKIDPYSYLDRSDMGLFFDKFWLSSYSGAHFGHNGYNLLERVPLGYSLGNDLMRFFVQGRYEIPNFVALWTEQSILLKGANTLSTLWLDINARESLKHAPFKPLRIQVASNFGGQVSFASWLSGQKLSFKGDLTFLNTIFKDDSSLDIQLGLGLAYVY